MKIKMMINNIAFCNIIVFNLGLITFKQTIILLQKKEFSLTKLIPKGYTFPSWTGLYCFFYSVGLLSYILYNIAINMFKIFGTVADNLLLLAFSFGWQSLPPIAFGSIGGGFKLTSCLQ